MRTFERLRALTQEPMNASHIASGSVTKEDFLHAMAQVKPSALREVEIDIPKVCNSSFLLDGCRVNNNLIMGYVR